MEPWEHIQGAKEFVEWFGRWPSFHDAEMQHLHLTSHGQSSLRLYTSQMLNDTDERGYYKSDKHVIVEFSLFDIEDVEIGGRDFYCGTILFSLACTKESECLKLAWYQTVGIGAQLSARRVELRFTPLDGPIR